MKTIFLPLFLFVLSLTPLPAAQNCEFLCLWTPIDGCWWLLICSPDTPALPPCYPSCYLNSTDPLATTILPAYKTPVPEPRIKEFKTLEARDKFLTTLSLK